MKKFLLILSLAAICVCCSSPAGQRPKVLAHRGLCTTGTEFTTDENTLDALIRAQEKGRVGEAFLRMRGKITHIFILPGSIHCSHTFHPLK